MLYTRYHSPVGPLLLAGDDNGLQLIGFPEGKQQRCVQTDWHCDANAAPLRATAEQLGAYFAGELRHFDLPLMPLGTPFQQRVWDALQTIPYGQTWSYRQLAEAIGNPTASRAVGGANGANPLPIVIPCHRVIGSNGSLTGFGGGLPVKQRLLLLEAEHSADLL